jgi:hypothetical protein
MGIFFWKKTRIIDAFANAVAEDLFSHVQPEKARLHFYGSSSQSKKKNFKIEQKLFGVIKQMQQFREANSLGVYGKARLQMKFNERLQELGYDTSVTDKLDEIILLRRP